ncbi:unnamed protein product [Cunninghamella blakesleeana]
MVAGTNNNSSSNGSVSNRGNGKMSNRDENYMVLTEALERERDTDQYDPTQDKEVRRRLRQDYRKLILETEEHRKELSKVDDHGLEETLSQANVLFTQVRNTQEAALDSKLLVLSADITTQKARNLRMDHNLFNIDEFIARLKSYCGGHPENTNQEWKWKKLGQRASKFGRRGHSSNFILGPLSVEKRAKKVVRQVRLTKNKEDLVQPDKLQVDDIQQQTNETSSNVNQIYKILDRQGPTNYFVFITNPDSFSQSVENMFYVSFLIRNGVAEIDDSSGQPILSTRAHPTVEELAAGLSKKQIIMNLSIPLWKVSIKYIDI